MMNKSQMAEIVSLSSALDGQIVSESKVVMWMAMLDGFTYEDLKDAIIPAYKESQAGVVTAKGLWDQVRRGKMQPVTRGWVRDMHDIGEHWECRSGEFGHV